MKTQTELTAKRWKAAQLISIAVTLIGLWLLVSAGDSIPRSVSGIWMVLVGLTSTVMVKLSIWWFHG